MGEGIDQESRRELVSVRRFRAPERLEQVASFGAPRTARRLKTSSDEFLRRSATPTNCSRMEFALESLDGHMPRSARLRMRSDLIRTDLSSDDTAGMIRGACVDDFLGNKLGASGAA